MSVLNISAREWILDESGNLKRLLEPETWQKIPLLNANSVQNFKDGTIIRFRGMVQDMSGTEYYLEQYQVINCTTNEISMRSGKYCDEAVRNQDEKIDLGSNIHKPSERQLYVITSIPAINSWAQELEKGLHAIPAATQQHISSSHKRRIDEIMDTDDPSTSSNVKKVTTSPPGNETSKPCTIVSKEHLLNHPLANQESKVCHMRVYKDSKSLKLNDVCDFVGFLSISSVDDENDEDELINQMEFQTHHPPGSLVPRIHVIHFKPLLHANPLLDQNMIINSSHFATIKKELFILLTQLLLGDTCAAEYLLCNLISEVYLRRELMPLGKFTLNISNVPKLENIEYVHEVYKFLEMMLVKSHYLPLTLENMNTLPIIPRKDYDCDRLTGAILQLSKNTSVVLDETRLQEGKLDAAGVKGVQAIANAIKKQKVNYDFNYYPIEFDCDIPFVIFSEGKSMLPSDVHIPLKPDDQCRDTFSEILEAARHFLKPELLQDIRKYLTEARLLNYEMSDNVQELVQQEFVNMRQNDGNVTADDLHSLLVLARLVCISEGKTTLDADCWQRACQMEKERKSRLSK
ncbi:mini-chromosome maintenance complex-binding protein [Anthonomus grandis grandis]|uniref:mini-chromosome maintenance complex-binding protein n=1 Tax=Anthonomus grandis grandis TaxID=2921223 RepID=UPI0021667E00|nr:mini-chromosome maintenance complex-binding protein [Anthonomus grandis grandis]